MNVKWNSNRRKKE